MLSDRQRQRFLKGIIAPAWLFLVDFEIFIGMGGRYSNQVLVTLFFSSTQRQATTTGIYYAENTA